MTDRQKSELRLRRGLQEIHARYYALRRAHLDAEYEQAEAGSRPATSPPPEVRAEPERTEQPPLPVYRLELPDNDLPIM